MAKSKALKPVERASTLTELRPIGSEALSVFSCSGIKFELEALQKLLDLPKKPEAVDLEEDEWAEIMADLLHGQGAIQLDLTSWHPRVLDQEEWRQALAGRVQQALRAVDHASRSVDADSTATGLLLPVSYARRIEILLGRGILPVAWVRQLDLLRF